MSNPTEIGEIIRAVDEPTPLWCGPWIGVFVLPGKINVCQHGDD